MKEDYVTREIAVKLKEKGFKEGCFGYYMPFGDAELIFNQTPYRGAASEDCMYSYNSLPSECVGSDFIDAPTISQALKWLRVMWKVVVTPEYLFTEYDDWFFNIRIIGRYGEYESDEMYSSYEKAAIAGIEYVIDKLIKE